MTDSSFNVDFQIHAEQTVTTATTPDIDKQLSWEVGFKTDEGDESGKLYFARKEATAFIDKSSLGDSVITDEFITTRQGDGLVHVEAGEENRLPMIRTGLSDSESAIILSNINSSLDIMKKAGSPIRVIEPVGEPIQLVEFPSQFTQVHTDWSVKVSNPRSSIFISNALDIRTAGVPYRWSIVTPQGHILYETYTEYEWELIKKEPARADRLTIGNGERTIITYPDPFFMDVGVKHTARLQTATPVTLGGFTLPDATGVPSFFLASINTIQEFNLSEWNPNVCDYEFAARHDATPHSIHLENGCTILNEEGEYIYWHNELGVLSTEERMCNYEWAVREIASPNSIHLENNCIILNNDDEYIEWIL